MLLTNSCSLEQKKLSWSFNSLSAQNLTGFHGLNTLGRGILDKLVYNFAVPVVQVLA